MDRCRWRPPRPRWLEGDPGGEAPADTESLAAALAAHTQVWVTGPRARAWAALRSGSSAQDVCVADLAGCTSPASVTVAIGQALGVWPPAGLETRDLTRRVLLLAAEGCDAISLGWLLDSLPDVRWVVWAGPDAPAGPHPGHAVHLEGADPRRTAGAAHPLARGLAALPRGADLSEAQAAGLGLAAGERPCPPRAGAPAARIDPLDAEALAETQERWLAIAEGQPLPGLPCLADALALELLARALPDAEDRARAAAAAARLWIGWGAETHAAALLRAAEEATPAGAARGLLRWARARLALDGVAESRAAVEAAAADFRAARALELLAALRRWEGGRQARAGQTDVAHRSWSEARALARQLDHAAPATAALLGSVSLAVRAGERLGASALLEQARSRALVPSAAAAARLLAKSLDPSSALPVTDGVPDAALPPVMQAWRHLRAAEASPDPQAGERQALEAQRLFEGLGKDLESAAALLVAGDHAAAQGQHAQAAARWSSAVRRALAGGDRALPGRGLRRLQALATWVGDDPAATAFGRAQAALPGA